MPTITTVQIDRDRLRAERFRARAAVARALQERPVHSGWRNALEKAGEELLKQPQVDVEVDDTGAIVALIYPPQDRIGVTYYTQGDACQCESWNAPSDPDDPTSPPAHKPCRHRAKLRLVQRAAARA